MVVALEDQRVLLRRERAVKLLKLLEANDARLQQEGKQGHAVAVVLGGGVELLAIRLQLGDVGFVLLRDMRDVQPGAVQMRTRQALDPRQRPGLDRAELAEILRRDLRYAAAGRCRGRRRGG